MLVNTDTIKDLKLGDIIYCFDLDKNGYVSKTVQALNLVDMQVGMVSDAKLNQISLKDTACTPTLLEHGAYPIVTTLPDMLTLTNQMNMHKTKTPGQIVNIAGLVTLGVR